LSNLGRERIWKGVRWNGLVLEENTFQKEKKLSVQEKTLCNIGKKENQEALRKGLKVK